MTLYDELEVRTDATTADIRAAFRQLAMKHHPDRGGSAAKMQRLHEAYEILRDPDARAAYDRSLAREQAARRRASAPRAPAPRPPARRERAPTGFDTFMDRLANAVGRAVLEELDHAAAEALEQRIGRRVSLAEILEATSDPAPSRPPQRSRGTGTRR